LQAYRSAFEEFSARVRDLQCLREQTHLDQRALDAALVELEKAGMAYRESRDALALQLLPPLSDGIMSKGQIVSLETETVRVRRIAELRWELSGKPEGTANDDWARAEDIIRRATAA
jgi:hypothetical protein